MADRLAAGRAELRYDREHGYLPALLAGLDAPVSSQTLVFSRTSFQASRIPARLPRAVYHNEVTYIGFVRGGDILEIASVDALNQSLRWRPCGFAIGLELVISNGYSSDFVNLHGPREFT